MRKFCCTYGCWQETLIFSRFLKIVLTVDSESPKSLPTIVALPPFFILLNTFFFNYKVTLLRSFFCTGGIFDVALNYVCISNKCTQHKTRLPAELNMTEQTKRTRESPQNKVEGRMFRGSGDSHDHREVDDYIMFIRTLSRNARHLSAKFEIRVIVKQRTMRSRKAGFYCTSFRKLNAFI